MARKDNKAVCGTRFGTLTAAERRALPESDWGLTTGTRSTWKYPMPDSSHAKNAKARAKTAREDGYLTAAEYRKIVNKANRIIARCSRRGSKNVSAKKGRTAVVNEPKKKKRKTRSDKGKRRPKGYGSAKRKRGKRKKNPATKRNRYQSTTYYQRANNPSMFDMNTYTRVLPAATAGVWLSRFAVKLAGPFEAGPDNDEPGLEHAIAIAIGLQIGAPMIGRLLPGEYKKEVDIAQIAGLGFMGDLFLRKRFLKNRPWIEDNLYLDGYDEDDDEDDDDDDSVNGFQTSTPLGQDTWTDSAGNVYKAGAGGGWDLAGFYDGNRNLVTDAQAVANRQARLLEAPTPSLPGGATPSDMQGFQTRSPLGHSVPANNSFGYHRTG